MKYKLTDKFITVKKKKLYQIKALADIYMYGVKAGDLGGYIESEYNLENDGNAWIYDNGMVGGNAVVGADAIVGADAWIRNSGDILYIKGLGYINRSTTVFRCKDNIVRIKCGCFYGTVKDFKKQVIYTRYGKIKNEYLKFAELVEVYFGLDKS